jgi:hypothetical protein
MFEDILVPRTTIRRERHGLTGQRRDAYDEIIKVRKSARKVLEPRAA